MPQLQNIPTLAAPPRPGIDRLLVPAVCVAFSAAMALFSRGFLEPDEITHFLYARQAWHDPRALVSIWGRLGCTATFALAAPGGIFAARLLAVALAALVALATARLLKHFSPDTPRSFAWLLLYAQPCFVLNSFTVMTELLLACCWAWAAVMLVSRSRGRWPLAAFLLGLGGLMRPEGWVALAIWPAFALLWLLRVERARVSPRLCGRLFLYSLLAALPTLGWYGLGAWICRDARWVAAAWPWSAASQYGHTGGQFLLSACVALAAWMWVPVLAACHRCLAHRRLTPAGYQAALLLVAPAAGLFFLHATLGTLGLFGSLSLPRYFLGVAPFLAVLTAMGLPVLLPAMRRRWQVTLPLALLPAALLAAFGYLPMRATVEQQRLGLLADASVARRIPAERLIVNHPYLLLRLGLDADSLGHQRARSAEAIRTAPAGTVVLTDETVWAYESRPTAADLRSWGYAEDGELARQVDAVPARVEPLTFHPDPDARVRLWIKTAASE